MTSYVTSHVISNIDFIFVWHLNMTCKYDAYIGHLNMVSYFHVYLWEKLLGPKLSTHATIDVAFFSETVSEGWRSLGQNRPKHAIFLHDFRCIPQWPCFLSSDTYRFYVSPNQFLREVVSSQIEG